MDLILRIEKLLLKKSKKKLLKIQPGDIFKTKANIVKLKNINNKFPKTQINEGLIKFIDWYKKYYKIKT